MDIDENDQDVPETARYGRPITPGTYEGTVVASEEGFTNAGAPRTKLVLEFNPGPEKAPEGPVKIDYYAVAKQFSLRNMVEVFEPEKLGKKASLDTASYVGRKVKAVVKIEPAKQKPGATPEQLADGTGYYKARAAIAKLIGSATKVSAAKQEDAF